MANLKRANLTALLLLLGAIVSSPLSAYSSISPLMSNETFFAASNSKIVSDEVRFYSKKKMVAVTQAVVSVDGKEYFAFKRCNLLPSNGQKTKLEDNLRVGRCTLMADHWIQHHPSTVNGVNEKFDINVRNRLEQYARSDDDYGKAWVGTGALEFITGAVLISTRPPSVPMRVVARTGAAIAVVTGAIFAWLGTHTLTNRQFSIETALDDKGTDRKIEDVQVIIDIVDISLRDAVDSVVKLYLL